MSWKSKDEKPEKESVYLVNGLTAGCACVPTMKLFPARWSEKRQQFEGGEYGCKVTVSKWLDIELVCRETQ